MKGVDASHVYIYEPTTNQSAILTLDRTDWGTLWTGTLRVTTLMQIDIPSNLKTAVPYIPDFPTAHGNVRSRWAPACEPM